MSMTDEERKRLLRAVVLVGPKGIRVETTLGTTLAGQLELDIEGGRTHTLRLSWVDGDTAEVRDLATDYTAVFTIKRYAGAEDVVLELAEGAGIELSAFEPNIMVTITAAEATALADTLSRGSYELTVTETDGDTWRLIEGTVAVRRAV